jgi:hypothetical protein
MKFDTMYTVVKGVWYAQGEDGVVAVYKGPGEPPEIKKMRREGLM